jgi:hypothetical protein
MPITTSMVVWSQGAEFFPRSYVPQCIRHARPVPTSRHCTEQTNEQYVVSCLIHIPTSTFCLTSTTAPKLTTDRCWEKYERFTYMHTEAHIWCTRTGPCVNCTYFSSSDERCSRLPIKRLTFRELTLDRLSVRQLVDACARVLLPLVGFVSHRSLDLGGARSKVRDCWNLEVDQKPT